jgi:type I restriction enzyme S subunit
MLSVTINNGVIPASALDRKDNSSEDKSHYKSVHIGDLPYNSMRMWQGASGISLYEGIVSPAYTVLRPQKGAITAFFAAAFKQSKMLQTFQRFSQGLTSDTWNLKYPQLSLITVSAPEIDEQLRISHFVEVCDSLVTAHERKLDLLKKKKTHYLQQIFIQKLRFKDFTEPWEQRKLGEVVTFVGGGTPSKTHPEYWKGNIVWLSSQEIKGGYISSGTYAITKEAVADSATRLVDAYTPLIISRSGILAHSFPVTLPIKPVAINQDIKALLFDTSQITTDFIVATLQKSEDEILTSIVKTGTTVQSVNLPDLKRLEIGIPAVAEQNRVSALFKVLDSLIAAHERKLKLLEKSKHAYLQKLFV